MKIVDSVRQRYRVDPQRIHITGLSMGGHGTWSAATSFPDFWASATVVCGFGDAALASKVNTLPMRLYCGDKDMPRIVTGMKQLEEALAKAQSSAVSEWFPGVGHNCWDLTYNKEDLFDWMLKTTKQTR